MKIKILFIGLLFFFSNQTLTAQNKASEIKKLATIAYKNKDYVTAIKKINEMEKLYKQMPYTFLSMRIISLNNVISENPNNNFQNTLDCKKFINNYLKIPNIKDLDFSYDEIIEINSKLTKIPNDYEAFIKYINEIENEKKTKRIKDSIINIRKDRLDPFSLYIHTDASNLGNISEEEFNNLYESTKIKYEEVKKEKLKKEKLFENRKEIIKPYTNFVSAYDYSIIGDIDDDTFNKILKDAKEKYKTNKKNSQNLNSFKNIGLIFGEIANFGIIYEIGSNNNFGYRFALRSSFTSNEKIINGKVKKNKTEFEVGSNYKIDNRIYLNFGIGYGYYKRLLNNDFSGSIFTENKGYFVTTTGMMYRINNLFNINCGLAFMNIYEDIYNPEVTFGVSYNIKKYTEKQKNSYSKSIQKNEKKYYKSLPSFSSLGFYSGKNAKYGLFYETGGNSIIGFHVSARTSLKEETIINGQINLNRSELALGPNFRMSNRLYLNLGVGYGIYDYGLSSDIYMDTDDYFTGNAGIMFRVSKVININAGYTFENFDIEYDKPEMTFGISFNIWD
jgi:hypothetical protein